MADSHEIYNLGRLCEGAFHDLLSDRSLASFPIVDVLYQHFQQWASYLGVFAEESISLDSRLRTSDSLRTLVLQLLEITKRNLIRSQSRVSTICFGNEVRCQRCRSELTIFIAMAIENEKTGSESPASLIESMDRRTSENVSSPLVETLQALEAALDSLHRLGVAMRQTSSSNLTQRIVAFIDKEDDGDLQDLICFRLKHKLMASARNQGKDTGPPLSLCKQLAVSISFRYFRIRYLRSHAEKLSTPRHDDAATVRLKGGPTPVPKSLNDRLILPTQGEGRCVIPFRVSPRLNRLGPPSISEPTMPDSRLALRKYRDTDPARTAGSTISVPLQDVRYPEPPKIEPSAKVVACPYCTHPIGEKIVKDKRLWEY